MQALSGLVEVKVPESWKNCADEGLDMVHATEGREEVIRLRKQHPGCCKRSGR